MNIHLFKDFEYTSKYILRKSFPTLNINIRLVRIRSAVKKVLLGCYILNDIDYIKYFLNKTPLIYRNELISIVTDTINIMTTESNWPAVFIKSKYGTFIDRCVMISGLIIKSLFHIPTLVDMVICANLESNYTGIPDTLIEKQRYMRSIIW
jgi:hypothetical protein